MTEQLINNEIDNRAKWEILGFFNKQHYQGFLDFNGLDATPYKPELTEGDLERLYTLFEIQEDSPKDDIDSRYDDALDAYSYVAEFGTMERFEE